MPAFGELSRRYQPRLRVFLTRICSPPVEPEDLAQDAFLLAWQRIKSLKRPAAFRAWLFTLALRAEKDRRKSSFRSRLRDRLWSDQRSEDLASTDAESAMARLDIDRAFANLSDKERVVAALVLGAGFSQSEASEVADIPLGSVKTYSLRAREKLAGQLTEWRRDTIEPETREHS